MTTYAPRLGIEHVHSLRLGLANLTVVTVADDGQPPLPASAAPPTASW